MPAYNLFRRKGRLSLYCAVPEDAPVPSFMTESMWEFGGEVEEDQECPWRFRRRCSACEHPLQRPLCLSAVPTGAPDGGTLPPVAG